MDNTTLSTLPAWPIWLIGGLFFINCCIKAYGFVMLWREPKEADKIGGEK